MSDNLSLTIADIRAARERIASFILRTPLLRSDALDDHAGGAVLCKAECLQGTGSFKLRGALNHLLSLTDEEKARGVVAYSSGNHAQGVARAAKIVGVRATIVMPADAPSAKRERTARDGAEIVLYDRERENREAIGASLAKEQGAKLIPPYDHALTIAGQGTAGLEIVEDGPGPIDQVVICCGGGGLAAGLSIAVLDRYPGAKIVLAEPEGFDDFGRSLALGERVENTALGGSICDALLAPAPGALTFPILRSVGAEGVVVSDDEALDAVLFAFKELRVVLEPGGAVALAAVLAGRVDTQAKRTVVILSGGNADLTILSRALER
ncbi:MAG: threonine/serine dehydratase [Pseudomonadota bacterium]